MTGQELLKLAAKAAGIEFAPSIGFPHVYIDAGAGLLKPWDPLTDDGDALRLAISLGIKVCPYPIFTQEKHSVIASRRWFAPPEDDENTYVGVDLFERYQNDKYAATRRAIVRAAAEIGKSMP